MMGCDRQFRFGVSGSTTWAYQTTRKLRTGFLRGVGAGSGLSLFKAIITAILANFSGPARSTTKVNAAIAIC